LKYTKISAALVTATLAASHANAEPVQYQVYDPETASTQTVAVAETAQAAPIDKVQGPYYVESGSMEIPDPIMDKLAAAKSAYPDYAPLPDDYVQADLNSIPFGIVDEDDREIVQDTTVFPASAVVFLNFTNAKGHSETCSGSMVSTNLVLTAGHCVQSLTRKTLKFHSDFIVFPGRAGASQPYQFCKGTQLYVLSDWQGKHADYDLGAVRLNCDIGKRTGTIGFRALGDKESGLTLTVQGYPYDKIPRGRQFFSSDKVRTVAALRITHESDTVGGMSGAPVYSGNDHRLFAVHASMKPKKGGAKNEATLNYATRITPDRVRVIRSWINAGG